jgi:hypothetical protein
MWRRLRVGLLLPFALLGACSDEDSDDADEPEWLCFEGPSHCWCTDVSDGDQAGSSDPEVSACSYTNCIAYNDGGQCWCEPAPFTPDPDMMEDARAVAHCPP